MPSIILKRVFREIFTGCESLCSRLQDEVGG